MSENVALPRRRFVTGVLGGGVLLTVALGGLSSTARAAPSATVVKMTDEMKFNPSPVEIHVGDTIRWESVSALVHTVTADPALAKKPADVALPDGVATFNSGNIPPGGHFEHTFKIPGKYRYFCIPHEAAGMVGEIIVKP